MAYIAIDDMRQHLDIESDDDDEALFDAIADAQSYIEDQTNRRFEANTETRYYGRDALSPDNSCLLLVDDDLLTVTELLNGDSDSTEIVTANYWLYPRNETPYYGILLKTDVSDYWEFDTDYWVEVTGTWGYSATPPGDIKRACKHLAAFFYRQASSQIFDTTAIPEAGVITIPTGIPATVERILSRYRKHL